MITADAHSSDSNRKTLKTLLTTMSVPPMNPPLLAAGTSDKIQCKNRLQEYTQKASIALPVYQTFMEGPPHEPQFRSQVLVDRAWFSSPNTFPNKRMAEQDAASHALTGILGKVKSEEPSHILDNTILCKSIVNEYALKMNVKTPIYTTNASDSVIPMFTSSMELNGATYIGQAAKSKKEAEHLAARSAILSILGFGSSTTMSEIVKSKFKFYDALKIGKEFPGAQAGTSVVASDAVDLSEHSGAPLLAVDKKNEAHVVGGGPVAEISQPGLIVPHCPLPGVIQNVLPVSANDLSGVQPANAEDFPGVQAGTNNVASGEVDLSGHNGSLLLVCDRKIDAHVVDEVTVARIPQPGLLVPHSQLPGVIQNVLPDFSMERARDTTAQSQTEYNHVFKKPKLSQPSPLVITPPTESVGPLIGLAPLIEFVSPASEQASVSLKKKNSRKKKGKKIGQLHQSPLPVDMIAQSSAPAYPVTQ